LDEIKKQDLKEADIIFYQVMNIIDGSCNPHIESNKVEKV